MHTIYNVLNGLRKYVSDLGEDDPTMLMGRKDHLNRPILLVVCRFIISARYIGNVLIFLKHSFDGFHIPVTVTCTNVSVQEGPKTA